MWLRIAIFSGLLFPSLASAETDPAAAAVCNAIPYEDVKLACVKVIAGKRVSADAARVCQKIAYADQQLRCITAIVNRTVVPQAARVCEKVGYADKQVECLSAALDKSYDEAETNLCAQSAYADKIVDCMRTTGRPLRPVSDDSDDRRSRRSSYLTLRNETRTPIVGIYARSTGSRRWTGNQITRTLPPAEQVSVTLPAGQWDVCFEAQGGWSTNFLDVRVSDEGNALSLNRGLDDPSVWANRACSEPADSSSRRASRLAVRNDTRTPIITFQYRPVAGGRRWSSNVLPRHILSGDQVWLTLPAGHWDLCAEASDGASVYTSIWDDIRVSDDDTRPMAVKHGLDDPSYWRANSRCADRE